MISTPRARKNNYVGRFAPSPTGALHLGSLAAALASYLDAKSHNGRWLVRIEDIDPPRDIPGADKDILQSLIEHGLRWDNEVIYQSNRISAYKKAFDHLHKRDLIYECDCTRRRLRTIDREYDNLCRQLTTEHDGFISAQGQPAGSQKAMPAYRFNLERARRCNHSDLKGASSNETPLIQDRLVVNRPDTYYNDDIVVKRKDGLFAYNLAVVVDDIDSKITDIVRGDDLLTMSSRQGILAATLGGIPARTLHIPVLCDAYGAKLSKQHGAPAIDDRKPVENILDVAQKLELISSDEEVNLKKHSIERILIYLTERWSHFLAARCNG